MPHFLCVPLYASVCSIEAMRKRSFLQMPCTILMRGLRIEYLMSKYFRSWQNFFLLLLLDFFFLVQRTHEIRTCKCECVVVWEIEWSSKTRECACLLHKFTFHIFFARVCTFHSGIDWILRTSKQQEIAGEIIEAIHCNFDWCIWLGRLGNFNWIDVGVSTVNSYDFKMILMLTSAHYWII